MKRFLFFAIVSFVLCACNNTFDGVQKKVDDNKFYFSIDMSMGENRTFKLPPTGGRLGFTVTSDSNITYKPILEGSEEWVTVKVNGQERSDKSESSDGTMEFDIKVAACNDLTYEPALRTFTIQLSCDNKNVPTTITISQDKPYFLMTIDDEQKNNYEFKYDHIKSNLDKEPIKLTIKSNVDWTITDAEGAEGAEGAQDWLELDGGDVDNPFEHPLPEFNYQAGKYKSDTVRHIKIIPNECYMGDNDTRNRLIEFKIGNELGVSNGRQTFTVKQKKLQFKVIGSSSSLSVLLRPCNNNKKGEFRVSSPNEWKVIKESAEDWFTWETEHYGKGENMPLSFVCTKANATFKELKDSVQVACVISTNMAEKDLPCKWIQVSQSAYELGVSNQPNETKSKYTLTLENGTKDHTFYVYSSGKWTITDVAPGLTIGGTLSGSGMEYGERVSAQNLTCAFNERNYDDEDCTLYFTLQSEEEGATDLSKKIAVVQEKYVLDAELKNTPLPVNAGSSTENYGTMDIESSGDWQVKLEPSVHWLSFSKTSGSGNDGITFWANSINPNTTERSGVIRLISTTHAAVGKSLEKEYTVKQQPFIFDVKQESLTFDAIDDDDSQTVDILCSAGWSVESDKTWVKFDPKSGNGDGKIEISVEQYTDINEPRTAELTIANNFNNEKRTIGITQKAFVFTVASTPSGYENKPTDATVANIPAAANTSDFSDMRIKLDINCEGGEYNVSCSYDLKRDNDKTTIDIPWNQYTSKPRPIDVIVTSILTNKSKTLWFQQEKLSFNSGGQIVKPAAVKGVSDDKITFKSSGAWVIVYKDNCDSWMRLVDGNGMVYTKDTIFEKTDDLTLYVETTEDNTGKEREGYVYLCLLQSKDSESTDEEKIGYGKFKKIEVRQRAAAQ